MRVFKFGGASVKDANGVKNVIRVLDKVGYENTLIVVSAMGKTTNAIEVIIDKYLNDKKELVHEFTKLKAYHTSILSGLFETQQHPVYAKVNTLFEAFEQFFNTNKSPNYNFIYDQVNQILG